MSHLESEFLTVLKINFKLFRKLSEIILLRVLIMQKKSTTSSTVMKSILMSIFGTKPVLSPSKFCLKSALEQH